MLKSIGFEEFWHQRLVIVFRKTESWSKHFFTYDKEQVKRIVAKPARWRSLLCSKRKNLEAHTKYKEGNAVADNKNIQQKDHLILPYSTLRRFEDEKHEIAVLNLNSFDNVKVEKRRPKSYHTGANYYIPVYDAEVKERERLIGILYTKLTKAIDEIEAGNAPSERLDRVELNQQIIDLATIEFHRLAIVDDEILQQYREQQQKRNDEEDLALFKSGIITKQRIEYSTSFRDKAKDLELFRLYAQNILGTKNGAFISLYESFNSMVLYAPKSADYSFWLPPFHFIGNECFLIFVISPRIAVALYPADAIKEMEKNVVYSPFFEVDEQRMNTINSRTFEEIGAMPDGFKELIGSQKDMGELRAFIEQVNKWTSKEENVLKIRGTDGFLKNENIVFRTAIVLYLIYANGSRLDLIIEPDVFETSYFRSNQETIVRWFLKYGFNLRVEMLGKQSGKELLINNI